MTAGIGGRFGRVLSELCAFRQFFVDNDFGVTAATAVEMLDFINLF
jgi:hypothetical protein